MTSDIVGKVIEVIAHCYQTHQTMAYKRIATIFLLHRLYKPDRLEELHYLISYYSFCTNYNPQMQWKPHLHPLLLCGSCSPPLDCVLWLPCVNHHKQKWYEIKCLKQRGQTHRYKTVKDNNVMQHNIQRCNKFLFACI